MGEKEEGKKSGGEGMKQKDGEGGTKKRNTMIINIDCHYVRI